MKRLMVVPFLLVISFSAFSQEQIGNRLKFEVESVVDPNFYCWIRITDVYDEKYMYIHIEKSINDIYIVYNSVYAAQRSGTRIGAANLYSNEFSSLLIRFITTWTATNNGNQEWNRYASTIAEKIEQYVKSKNPSVNRPSVPNPGNGGRGSSTGQPSDPDNGRRNTVGNPPERIISTGKISRIDLAGFLLSEQPTFRIAIDDVLRFIDLYIAEAEYEGVNYEIAFAQMLYHTNYMTNWEILSKAEKNNFCGLTSLHDSRQLLVFRSEEEGIRAHIQHLKGYATSEPPRKNVVDPRYEQIRKTHGLGVSPTIDGLSNRWAGSDYSDKIKRVLQKLYEHVNYINM